MPGQALSIAFQHVFRILRLILTIQIGFLNIINSLVYEKVLSFDYISRYYDTYILKSYR